MANVVDSTQSACAIEPLPQKGHKTGFRGPSPDVGKATQIKKGQVLNPGGRPKKKPLTEEYERLLLEQVPNDSKKRIWARLIAEGQFKEAAKGKTAAADHIKDAVEGPVPRATHLSGPDGDPIVMVNIDVRERIRSISERLRNRPVKSG